MEEMCYLVATKHSGSLKGEHGTGRNVAPFVEMEWGAKAYDLMWELKVRLFWWLQSVGAGEAGVAEESCRFMCTHSGYVECICTCVWKLSLWCSDSTPVVEFLWV